MAESGTDPGPGLRRLQQQILRGDPELLRVPGTQLSVDRRPHNLPGDARVFVGRDDELRQLTDMVPGIAASRRIRGDRLGRKWHGRGR